jgi:formylmethanofuran dehydrogenase subunit C
VSEIVLRLVREPALRVDLRGVTPAALGALNDAQIARHAVWHGNERAPLAEFFAVERRASGDDDVLRFAGDMARFDFLGAGLDSGSIAVDGDAGDYLGLAMTAGSIAVRGSAGMFAACEMCGGSVHVAGGVGDFAAAARPGSMDGMRGGTLVVDGNAGARLGDRMRRGLVAVRGAAGDFAASRLVAGTIAIGGAIGANPAFGMRRGTLLLTHAPPRLAPTFVPSAHDFGVFWRLLGRHLHALGEPFAALAARRPLRFVGDLAVDGKGEVIGPA